MAKAEIPITVVVPSYNQGRFIDETIASLLDQEYPDLTILVMDGGSTDDTVDRLKRYGERISWISERDFGQSDAIAKGFARAPDGWITWLNSDDVQSNRALWAVNEVVARDPDAEVVVGQGHYMDEDGSNPRPYPTIEVGPKVDVARQMFEKGYLAQPSSFFRKSAYTKIGGINRALRFCMDYDLWTRFALAGCRFAACDVDISGNRWYATTKSAGQTLELLAEVAAVQVKHFGRVSPYFVQAISDNLYQTLHGNQHGDRHHVMYRLLYFKSVWLWFNIRQPAHCLRGLFKETIAKSGPLVGDRLTYSDCWRGLRKAVGSSKVVA
ncbi:glycosyltransferase involved in cell wall biosynthesis [Bradyrhizobium sp. USDA 4524]|uniref:glycosyltransferase family 2 protein n=1 Tax=unclassified Bradyrhizobium TaxID=2631580 RepID=UPI00209E585E|nr:MULTISPECIES: glycosyltransferase family 2 protein [unclassified Bradyrhizobium]MCP1845525.1 glycosyltransferase involved in cell wall biosynthesis [Bradyrhizobium sp. USDA 4538]MCP1907153.1 glycosyltransferase involved in cell wall biosynthesis [Bradyrhizobium sp. USDA 4537]MCP1985629.1 glycosyltransferase involved in cell wall biosynthesis [Bradyrhizobium sp. USDA 4539]